MHGDLQIKYRALKQEVMKNFVADITFYFKIKSGQKNSSHTYLWQNLERCFNKVMLTQVTYL